MTLNLKTANKSSCMTLWPMMMYRRTKLGYRWFSSWGEIVQMNIYWNFEHFCDLDHNRAIQSFHKTIQLIMMCHQTKFSCKRISSSDNVKKSLLIILTLTVTLTLKTANQSFLKTIWLIMMHHHTKFGIKRFSNSENIIQTSIHWHFEILLQPWPWTKPPNFSIKHSCL